MKFCRSKFSHSRLVEIDSGERTTKYATEFTENNSNDLSNSYIEGGVLGPGFCSSRLNLIYLKFGKFTK